MDSKIITGQLLKYMMMKKDHTLALLIMPPADVTSLHSRKATSHYIREYIRGYIPTQAYQNWEDGFSDVVLQPLASLVKYANNLSMTVYENATLHNLTEATTNCQDVVLLSHWKGPIIHITDFINFDIDDPKFIKIVEDRYRRYQCPFSESLNTYFSENDHETVGMFEDIFNLFITEEDNCWNIAHKSPDRFENVASPFTISSWNRDELDRLFKGLIHPGNRLELCDGMYSKEAVYNAINEKFTGFLDLTTCNSMLLSDYCSQQSRGRFHTVQFNRSLYPVEAWFTLKRTFQLYHEGEGMSYEYARTQAITDCIKAINSCITDTGTPP